MLVLPTSLQAPTRPVIASYDQDHSSKLSKEQQQESEILILGGEETMNNTASTDKECDNIAGAGGVEMSESFRRTSADQAKSIIEKRFQQSQFGQTIQHIPKFDRVELELGRRLGKGGFSYVDEIRGIYMKRGDGLNCNTPELVETNEERKDNNQDGQPLLPVKQVSRRNTVAKNDIESRQFIATHCIRPTGHARYAIKQLRKDIVNNTDQLLFGLCDLAVETRFLSSLEHPNIIKLRAIASTNDPYSSNYFVVLDRLFDTLQVRIHQIWYPQYKKLNNVIHRIIKDPSGTKRQDLFQERLISSFDLSDAIRYIHDNNIVHRDIKPENIGFDVRGDIKIFDFGMAKELRQEHLNEADGTYRHMSAMTGTLRYMAPEVWLGKPYNASCDVYSFAILFWEIMALEVPFAKIKGCKQFLKKIIEGKLRPPIKSNSWPKTIQDIMKACWSYDWQNRYTMQHISWTLRNELIGLRDGDDSGLEHQRRRSTHVFSAEVLDEVRDCVDADSVRSGKYAMDEDGLKGSSRSLGRAILGGSTRSLSPFRMGSCGSISSQKHGLRGSDFTSRSSSQYHPSDGPCKSLSSSSLSGQGAHTPSTRDSEMDGSIRFSNRQFRGSDRSLRSSSGGRCSNASGCSSTRSSSSTRYSGTRSSEFHPSPPMMSITEQ